MSTASSAAAAWEAQEAASDSPAMPVPPDTIDAVLVMSTLSPGRVGSGSLSKPPSGTTSGRLSADEGLKSKLLSHVENRPDREALMKRNIIKAYDSNTDPKLQGVMSSLIKTQTEDRLAQGLNKRRSVQELVAQGILMDQSKGTISVQLAQRALLRQMERDRLSQFLTTRPTLDELVKSKHNIMEDTMTWVRSASLTGSMPLPRNCLAEDARVLTEHGFLGLDEIKSRKRAPRYACFDPATNSIVYHPGTLFEQPPDPHRPMVELTPHAERRKWRQHSDEQMDKCDANSLFSYEEEASHISLLVTADHDMYAQFGVDSPSGDDSDVSWLRHAAHAPEYHKVPARDLLRSAACSCPPAVVPCSCRHSEGATRVRMLACATSGVTRDAEERTQLAHHLEQHLCLRGDRHLRALLRLYARWIARGGARVEHGLVLPTRSTQEATHVAHLLDELDLTEGVDWSSTPECVIITAPRWVAYFCANGNSTSSSQLHLFPWISSLLDATHLRLFAEELHRADGVAEEHRGHRVIRVAASDETLRDQLVHVCINAGFSAYFERATATDKCAAINHEDDTNAEWRILYLDPSTPHGERASTPSFRRDVDLVSHTAYTGRVWCVTVPTGLIFAQRTVRSFTDGVERVVRASRPLVVGNCHTMNSFPTSSKLYLLGGYGTGSTANSELLVLDTATDAWTRPSVGGTIPCERYSHTCSSLGGGQLVVFGGFSTNGSWLNDVYVLDTRVAHALYAKTTPSQTNNNSANASQQPSPVMRPMTEANGHTTTSMPLHSTLSSSSPSFHPAQYSTHNSPSGAPTQLSTLSALMWQQPTINGTPPSPRAAHASVVVGDCIWVFGGNDGATLFNDLHVLNTTTWSWSAPVVRDPLPPPRAGHTMNLLDGRFLVVFGGGTASGPVNDLFVLDTAAPAGALAWTRPKLSGTPPSPRAGHSACCAVGGQLLVFGGGYLNKVFNDLHLLRFDALVWARPADTGTVPSPRAGHSANVMGARIYVFAGGDAEHVYNDLHVLDTAFLRVRHQAAALHLQASLEQQAHGANGTVARSQGGLNDLSMSSLSLGPGAGPLAHSGSGAAHRGKSHSAPSSPTHARARSAGFGAERDAGDATSLMAPRLGRASPPNVGDGVLTVAAVAKVLAAQARERDEADRALLARVDAAADRVAHHIAAVWNTVDAHDDAAHDEEDAPPPPPDGRESSLFAALAYSMRAHSRARASVARDALTRAQHAATAELAAIRDLVLRRRADADDRAGEDAAHLHANLYAPHAHPSSVFQTLSHGSSPPPIAPPFATESAYYTNHHSAPHVLLNSPLVYPVDASGGPLAPPMIRSVSADNVDGVHAPPPRAAAARPRAGVIGIGLGALTVRPVPTPSPIPLAPGPPGPIGSPSLYGLPATPTKARRKRGGTKFKPRTTSANNSVHGTPVLRPQSATGTTGTGEAALDPTHPAHASKPSSASSSASHTTNSSTTSPSNGSVSGDRERDREPLVEAPPRVRTPNTPSSDASTQQ